MIFLFFKPLHIKEQEFNDVPLFNISSFMMHELNTKGLQTLVIGSKALRYSDRYVVNDIDFTDNSKQYISNMKADYGLYKDNTIDLEGNITYIREDGLEFESQTLHYNTKTAIATTDTKYIAKMGENSMEGNSLQYFSDKNKITSHNVVATYIIKER